MQELQGRINAALERHDHSTAIWLAERFHAMTNSYDAVSKLNALLLLASCHFRSGKPNRAYYLLRGSDRSDCRYLFALSCYELQKFQEAEAALCGSFGEKREIPSGGHHLLGLICQRLGRREQAIAYFRENLSLDPFAWSSFEALCELGKMEDVAPLFRVVPQPLPSADSPAMTSPPRYEVEAHMTPIQSRERRRQNLRSATPDPGKNEAPYSARLREHKSSTPTTPPTHSPTMIHSPLYALKNDLVTPHPPIKRLLKPSRYNPFLPVPTMCGPLVASSPKKTLLATVAETEPLDEQMDPKTNSCVNPKAAHSIFSPESNFLGSLLLPSATSPQIATPQPIVTQRPPHSFFDDLRTLARAFSLQSLYKGEQAIELYSKVSKEQRDTGWVLAQLSRCYFDLVSALSPNNEPLMIPSL